MSAERDLAEETNNRGIREESPHSRPAVMSSEEVQVFRSEVFASTRRNQRRGSLCSSNEDVISLTSKDEDQPSEHD